MKGKKGGLEILSCGVHPNLILIGTVKLALVALTAEICKDGQHLLQERGLPTHTGYPQPGGGESGGGSQFGWSIWGQVRVSVIRARNRGEIETLWGRVEPTHPTPPPGPTFKIPGPNTALEGTPSGVVGRPQAGNRPPPTAPPTAPRHTAAGGRRRGGPTRSPTAPPSAIRRPRSGERRTGPVPRGGTAALWRSPAALALLLAETRKVKPPPDLTASHNLSVEGNCYGAGG